MAHQTILLITPSPTSAAAIEVAATDLGYRVDRAHNTIEVLARLQAHPVSLIIADQEQRSGTGVDLLETVQDIRPDIPRALILGAADGSESVVEALSRSGVSIILKKPLTDLDFVRKSLQQTLSQISSSGPISQTETIHKRKLERLCTVGEIASDLIHQFSNILTIMNGHMELLLNELDDQKQKTRAETILQAGQDGARLTRSIQDFVRLSKAPVEKVHLNDLIRETLRMTEPIYKSRSKSNGHDIHIETRLNPLPEVTASAGEIREVLTNLVINAVDAMPHGGTLTLRTTTQDHNIMIEIEDSGIGMSDTVRDRIFDPFFTTKGEKGNGLGLGIVKRTLKACGGSIDVRSQPGQGSCFTICLPITKPTAIQNPNALVSA